MFRTHFETFLVHFCAQTHKSVFEKNLDNLKRLVALVIRYTKLSHFRVAIFFRFFFWNENSRYKNFRQFENFNLEQFPQNR